MIPILPTLITAIPSIIKLFDKDEKDEGVKELTSTVLTQASELLGVEVKSKEELLSHLNSNPDEVLKLKEMETNVEKELIKFDANTISEVNETMRTESKSEHWIQYSWRPFIGFSFGFYLNSLWLLPLFDKVATAMSVDMILTIGAILGVASWHRGMEKIEKAKK